MEDLPGGSDGKASACNAGDPGSIPGLGRSPEEGNGNPLQHSFLENPMDRRGKNIQNYYTKVLMSQITKMVGAVT